MPQLPQISQAFSEGRVSYSKVRAMTRVATVRNEGALLNTAYHGSAQQLERQVQLYRRIKRTEALAEEQVRYAHRELSWHVDDAGCWVFRGRLTAEQGAVIAKALEAAMDRSFEERRGEPLSVGRKTRSIPPTIRRALQRRDGGCCFPGCSATRFVDAHHVVHWADGGETRMSNLLLLCKRHHRLVHEGGFGLEVGRDGAFRFYTPDGTYLPNAADGRSRGNFDAIRAANAAAGLEITSHTAYGELDGDPVDWRLAMLELIQRE